MSQYAIEEDPEKGQPGFTTTTGDASSFQGGKAEGNTVVLHGLGEDTPGGTVHR